MASGGILGGPKIGYSANSPVSYTTIPGVLSFDKFFELTSPDIDTTVAGATIGTSMAGIPDPPELEFTILSDPDASTGVAEEYLRQRKLDGVSFWFRVERPVNRARTSFRAEELQVYVKGFSPSTPVKDRQTVKITLRYSGNYAIYGAGASVLSGS